MAEVIARHRDGRVIVKLKGNETASHKKSGWKQGTWPTHNQFDAKGEESWVTVRGWLAPAG